MTMIIRAPRPERGWTDLDNKVLRDPRISYRALGLLVRMLSNANGYRMTVVDLQSERDQEGRDAIRSALKELEAAGYLVRRRYRCEGGLWKTQVHVYDTPQPIEKTEDGFSGVGILENANEPRAGNPASGSPAVGFPASIQKDQQNKQQNTHPAPEGAGDPPPSGGGGWVEFSQGSPTHPAPEGAGGTPPEGGGESPPFPVELMGVWKGIISKVPKSRRPTLKKLVSSVRLSNALPLSPRDWEALFEKLALADDQVAFLKGVQKRGGWDPRDLAELAHPGETYQQVRQRISSKEGRLGPVAAPAAPAQVVTASPSPEDPGTPDLDLVEWVKPRSTDFKKWLEKQRDILSIHLLTSAGVGDPGLKKPIQMFYSTQMRKCANA